MHAIADGTFYGAVEFCTRRRLRIRGTRQPRIRTARVRAADVHWHVASAPPWHRAFLTTTGCGRSAMRNYRRGSGVRL